MNTFGAAQAGAGRAARVPTSGTRTATSTSTCSAGSRSTPWAMPTRRSSRPSPSSCGPWATSPTSSPAARRSSSPRTARSGGLVGRRTGPARSSSPTPGTEANEAALKLTRRTGRTQLVAAEGAFHGRTMGALALTAKAAYREPFEPLPGRGHLRARTATPMRSARGGDRRDRGGGARADPGRGRRGRAARGLPRALLAEITREHGALLWLDEIQTGMGRTGALVRPPADPDVSRPTGRGHPRQGYRPEGSRSVPASRSGRAADLLQPGNHGTTFGGNPVACAAALAVIGTIEDEDLLERATVAGREAPGRPRRGPPGGRSARRRPADRARPATARSAPESPPRPWRRASSSTTRHRSGSGSRRRWC